MQACDDNPPNPNNNFEVVPIVNEPFLPKIFTKKVDVIGVPIVATSEVRNEQLLHAAAVMAEYLDNDEDGMVDDLAVAIAMQDNSAILVMFPTEDGWNDFNTLDNETEMELNEFYGNFHVQRLFGDETNVPG